MHSKDLTALLRTINRAFCLVSTFGSFEEKDGIFDVLERIVKQLKKFSLVKMTLIPSYNDQTSYEDFNQELIKKDAPTGDDPKVDELEQA